MPGSCLPLFSPSRRLPARNDAKHRRKMHLNAAVVRVCLSFYLYDLAVHLVHASKRILQMKRQQRDISHKRKRCPLNRLELVPSHG